jgi:hypothetical protein
MEMRSAGYISLYDQPHSVSWILVATYNKPVCIVEEKEKAKRH